ncbi:glycosyltransferase family 2 protein [Acetobacteraceae bacterium KSS8]|uniref:Glycosyltransferase family 2 protein n=1 Tax=Endosaccharibacter trunci TaxID=2812733 RepID=A0ABT1W8U7_9PROT|nr:glycosyltransferase family 2 protein [Acetobacteraceae bacterium KSS8]
MQKNEILLEPWIIHHGILFGFGNLYVYDNGSDLASIKDILLRYAKLGVNVIWDCNKTEDFKNKGDIFAALIKKIQNEKSYDYFFPLDCDEFVMLSGENGFTSSKSEIDTYLDEHIGDDCVRAVNYQLINIPGKLDTFALIDFAKSVIPNRPLRYLDHGFHEAALASGAPAVKSRLVYAHLHNKPFPILLQSARQKLSPFIDCDDKEAIRDYSGNGFHLTKYFLEPESRYHMAYERSTRIHCDDLLRIFDTFRLWEFMRLWGMEMNDATAEYKTASCKVEGLYNRTSYLRKNPDVAESGMDPLVHYCMFGFREGRPV